MQRKTILGIVAAASVLALAGCGRASLTTTNETYHQDGMVAAVKGHTNANKVTYQVDDHTKESLTVHNGTFVIQVPTTTKRQSVKLTANGSRKTIHVSAAKVLTDYQTLQKSFNQALTGSKLSKADQGKAMALQKAAASLKKQPTPAAAAQVGALQKDVQAAMTTAKQQAKDQLLPVKTPANGVSDVVSTKDYRIRMNVQNGQVLGATMIVPTKAFKQKATQKQFGTSFALLTNGVGADSKSVMKQFGKETKSVKSGSSSIDPIYSKGVKFTIGLSPADIYIFVVK
ncbi:hypothetical protein [Furfurilactobacillus milii]|uniref:Lipoprotein n=1 Tax=Furfurilactobacillus milii TaxID=2888272 RepID=A0A6N9HZR7_9LACO|nr:hypothetical protein [Furfurilactobacillus milii]MYV16195.1 hypothetical protein [Furfurilactobacillus milii]